MTRPRSLHSRLLAPVLGWVAAVWLVIALATWFDVRHELDELLDGHLVQAASLLVVQQAPSSAAGQPMPDAALLHRYAGKVAFQVFRDGRLVQRSANAPEAPMREAGRPFKPGLATVRIGGMAWRVFATQGAQPEVQFFVGEQMESREDILWAVLRSTLPPLAVSLPLLALAVWWAVRRGVAPLRRLGSALAARDPAALEPIEAGDAPAEMLPMIAALNSLFARIAALIETERRFTADAAHELRTPIAAIRAQAQVALGAADDAQRRHALQATLQGCDRATRLVEQMLTLARLDAADAPPRRRIDLGGLARGVVADLAPMALRKRQSIAVEAEEAVSVSVESTLLEVLLRNLVDNAIRYAPGGAEIRIGVSKAAGRVRLTVDNSGPALAAADLERLGERFFRVPGSDASGSGLGWSIVRRIAAVHGAAIEVAAAGPLGGLSVGVDFAA